MFVSGLCLICMVWLTLFDLHIKQNSMLPPKIIGISVISTTGQQHYQMIVETELDAPIRCNRFIAHYITDSERGGGDTLIVENGLIIPLAMTISVDTLPQPPIKYKVLLSLPAAMHPGHWWYRNRTVYLCSIWPGFVTTRAFDAAKIPFDVSDSAVTHDQNQQ